MKKSILLLCDYFLPSTRAGGPLRSIVAIIEALKKDFDITVVTRNHDLCVVESYSDIISNQIQQVDGYQILYLSEKNKFAGIRYLLKNNHYDIIYCNSFFAPYFSVIPQFQEWLSRRKTRIIISPRGELGDGALSIKSIRKQYYLPVFKWLYANKNTEFLAASDSEKKEIGKAVGEGFIITTIANLSQQKNRSSVVNTKKENNLHIVFVSRISKKKNLSFALTVLFAVKERVTFDIYGPIEESEYWNDCLQLIQRLPSNIQVNYCGALHPDQVADTLPPYDLFFLPSWNENYGHAIVEALAAGCPVLLSNQTPWHDLSQYDAGWEFDLSKPNQFSEKIDSLAAINPKEYERYKKAALDYYKIRIANHSLQCTYKEFFCKS